MVLIHISSEICIFPYSISTNTSSIDIQVHVLKLWTMESHMRRAVYHNQANFQLVSGDIKFIANMYTHTVTENLSTKVNSLYMYALYQGTRTECVMWPKKTGHMHTT